MHRNTAVLLVVLALLATLVVGIRVGSTLNPISPLPTVNTSPEPIASTQALKHLTHAGCGVSFEYPGNLELVEASDSAILSPPGATESLANRIIVVCSDFPKPPLPDDKVEEATVAGQLATIYHDSSAQDGAPVDVVVFTHPKTRKEIGLFGFGEVFEKVLETVTFL